MSMSEGQRPECNPFLLLEGRPWETPRSSVYAILDQAENGENGLHTLIYSAVDADRFDELRREDAEARIDRRDYAAIFDGMPIFLLEVRLSSEAVLDLLHLAERQFRPADAYASGKSLPPEPFEQLEGKWWRFVFGPSGIAAALFPNLFAPEPRPVVLATAIEPSPRTLDLLNLVDPLTHEPDASTLDIEAELAGISGKNAVEQVVVYDVGQGGANGLLASDGSVAAYFDFGGGVSGNTRTFPSPLTSFCFCRSPDAPIILSHWDHDHWSSEGRDTRSHGKTWIAPRQAGKQTKNGFHHSALISSITAHGKLLIWPAGTTSLTVGQTTILKCTGTSKNRSGLAVEVEHPSWLSGLPVLLPADAGYGDLPPGASSDFDAIACPHHGGNSHSPRIPPRPSGIYQRLAYSYGPNNTHHHPLQSTWSAHDGVGWHDPRSGQPNPSEVLNTEDRMASGLGHIGLTWGATRLSPACAGTCQLGIQQT